MTRTIKFIRDYTVKTKDGPTYTSGQVVKVSEESANHFVNRGAAEDYTPPSKKSAAEVQQQAAEIQSKAANTPHKIETKAEAKSDK